MFDPFGDFATEGYLRNFEKEKDLEIVKIAEHELFRAQLPVPLRIDQNHHNVAGRRTKTALPKIFTRF